MKLLRYFLFPFAILYDLVTRIRNYCFDIGVFKETTFPISTIVVGNLSVGGTGKTPQIEYLIRLLKDNFKTAVLSRGYRRKTKNFILLDDTHTAEQVGDEPLQYFKKFDSIDVAVDGNRVEGVRKLIQKKSPELILLDDAYQHRKLKGSFYVLLTKYDDLFVDDFLLPTGNLRESSRGAERTNVIIVTKCPINLSVEAQNSIIQKLKKFNKKIFFTSISYHTQTSGYKQLPITVLKDYQVLLVTGIANPKPLLAHLKSQNINYKHLEFADHHHFSEKETEKIKNEFENIAASKKIILTTEKDHVRLSNLLPNSSFLGIKTCFLNETGKKFNAIINQHIQENQR